MEEGDENRSSDEQEENGDEHVESPKKPKTRGTTTGLKAAKRKGPRNIEFDENNVPVGVWKKDFATELGVQARNIKITFKSWKSVPGGKKKTIWKHLKKKYNIKDDTKEEIVLQIVSNRFKDFKSRLRGIFIYKTRKPANKKEELGDPLVVYKQITKEVWADFEKQANDPEFKSKSDRARESQKHNKCPHYMGRAGYAGKKDQWFEEELAEQKALNPDLDPAALEEIVKQRLMDRSISWIKGHTPAASDPPPDTQEMINNINHWWDLQQKGEFIPSRMVDVLVKATGKKDHPGFTRGVGSFVSNRQHFGELVPEKMYTLKEFEAAKAELQEKFREDMVQMMTKFARSNGWDFSGTFDFAEKEIPRATHEQISSCHSAEPDDPFDDLKDSVPCRLKVQNGDKLVVVAEGTVNPWKENTVVHHTPLTHSNVHVCIDKCLDPIAQLPVPWHGFTTVGEAEGSFAQWPKKWVSLTSIENELNDKFKKKDHSKETKESHNKGKRCEDDNPTRATKELMKSKKPAGKRKRNENSVNKDTDTQNKKKHSDDKRINMLMGNEAPNKYQVFIDPNENNDDPLPPLNQLEVAVVGLECRRLEGILVTLESNSVSFVKINIDSSVYGYTTTIVVHLTFNDMRQMFTNQWLNLSMLQVWGRFVFDHGRSLGVTEHHVGYLCPVELCSYKTNSTAMESYVTDMLKLNENKRYVMGAFHELNHWMLVVFSAKENIAYILDSHKEGNHKLAIRQNLKRAWKVYTFKGGIRHPSSNELTIKSIECPQQPGGFECGYYVMKWIYDITVHYAKSKQNLQECISRSSMAAKDVDRVREFWCQKFVDAMYY